jgi:hypothetical protein
MQDPIPPIRKTNFSFLKIVSAKCQERMIDIYEIEIIMNKTVVAAVSIKNPKIIIMVE